MKSINLPAELVTQDVPQTCLEMEAPSGGAHAMTHAASVPRLMSPPREEKAPRDFTRRQILRATTLGFAAVLMSPRRFLGQTSKHAGHIPGTGGGFGSSPLLKPFQDPLRLPPVLIPTTVGKTQCYTITMREGLTRMHRDLPPTVVWGYNGLFPGPTIKATRGHPVVIRQINRLPEEHPHALPAVHLHGARVAPEHDGHPREAIPANSFRDYHYPNRQRGMTLFFHDHAHGFTGAHVYAGLAGLYIIDDPAENRLSGLPQAEQDIPLVIQDRLFNADGSMRYALDSATRETGVLGDIILVNGVVQPYLEVATRKYRFRILNASNARAYDLQLSSGRPLIQIATDGGLLPKPLEKRVLTIAPAERAEVVIDFAEYPVGTQLILKNCACSDRTSDIMRFDVQRHEADNGIVPDCLSDWEDLPVDRGTIAREFVLNRLNSAAGMMWTINGKVYAMDAPPMVQVKAGAVERWRFSNPTNHPHPIHLHFVQFQILDINDQPQDPTQHGWKDTVVVPPDGSLTFAVRFGEITGRYLFHCHNLEHEDLGMMAEYEVVP